MHNFTQRLLTYSYQHNLSHIPSALSMADYLRVLFEHRIVTPDDVIVIGKPFGSQTYYLLWHELGYLTDIQGLSIGVKHDEIPFVDFSEETLGNALGVAAGIAMTTKKRVWVNLSDAALQMGPTLEAIQFIGHHNLRNVFVTVDHNNKQVTGDINTILPVEPVFAMASHYGWDVGRVDGHDTHAMKFMFEHGDSVRPNMFICDTIKGHGIKSMETDVKKWHYKKIETDEEFLELLNETHTA